MTAPKNNARENRRAGFQALWLALSLAAIGGVVWYGLGPGGWFRAPRELGLEGAEVQRGPLRISVTERGSLKAADSAVLKSEIEGSTTILWLIDEGVTVEEGELVCELDATGLIDDRFQRELSVRNAEAEYVKAKQAFEIQKSQNRSDIAKAEQNLEFAGQDLIKFREGEREKLVKEAEEAITLAEEEHTRAEEKLRWSTELEEKGFIQSTELEADKLAENRAGILLEQARRDRDLLKNFQLERDEAELKANLEEAERELERVELQAAARLVDYEAAMNTAKARLDLERGKLADLNAQIERSKLYAPRAGMVVYAKEPGGRYGREDPIAEGTQVRERQELVTIPSAEGMTAEVSLHETVLKQVRVGQSCVVRVDAIPGREFPGEVSFVALLPDQNSWWANPNQRLYRTEVRVGDSSREMRPGMSCSIEILVEDIDDAIYCPVQSIFRHGGANVAFVSDRAGGYQVREVEVGRYNDRWVQVLTGLAEGEVVFLSAPADFSLEPAGGEGAERRPDGAGGGEAAEGGAHGGSRGPHGGSPAAGAGVAAHPGPGSTGAPNGAEGGQAAGGGPSREPSAEQIEALRARAREAGAGEGGRPTAEEIEAWRKQRAAGAGLGGGGHDAGASTPGQGAKE